MKNISKSGRQLVAMIIVLAGLIGSPTLSVYSQPAANYGINKTLPATPSSVARPNQTAEARATELYSNLPLTFEANAGQTDSRVKFISRADGHTLFLTPTQAVLALDGNDSTAEREPLSQTAGTQTMLRMKFIGANPAPPVVGLEEQKGKTSYRNFTGSLYSITKSVALSAQTKSEPPTLYIGTRITNKAFLMKLSPERTLLYSSALGGNGWYQNDVGFAVAADDDGNAFVVGETYSSNFPTKNALQTAEDLNDYLFALSGFLTKINTISKPAPSPDPTPDPQPDPVVKITGVAVSGKKLFVIGENFSASATIMLNGAEWPAINDSQNPTTELMNKKAGKKVKPGRSVTIQVKNADGKMSESFQYVRPAN